LCATVQEGIDESGAPIPGYGQLKRRRPESVGDRINVSSVGEQKFGHGQMTGAGSAVQRSHILLVTTVYVRSPAQEKPDCFDVATFGSPMQRSLAVYVCTIDFQTGVEEALHQRDVVRQHSAMQGGRRGASCVVPCKV
jgi:hypothetical protein